MEHQIDGHGVSTDMTQLQLGLSTPFIYRFRQWKIWAGPRLAGTLMIRQPRDTVSSVVEKQRILAFHPGLTLGIGYTFFSRLNLEAGWRSSYTTFRVDNDSRHLLAYDVSVSLGWRFHFSVNRSY